MRAPPSDPHLPIAAPAAMGPFLSRFARERGSSGRLKSLKGDFGCWFSAAICRRLCLKVRTDGVRHPSEGCDSALRRPVILASDSDGCRIKSGMTRREAGSMRPSPPGGGSGWREGRRCAHPHPTLTLCLPPPAPALRRSHSSTKARGIPLSVIPAKAGIQRKAASAAASLTKRADARPGFPPSRE